MKIPLIDLAAQYHSIREEIDQAIREVLESGVFILGPNVGAFEEEVAAYLGIGYAVGVASGTDALALTLRAYAIGPEDEVIVPAFTFFATAEAVSQVGARPVFVDIDPKTYCLDAAQLESKLTPRTKAIIPVHLYGHPADMAPILELAKRRNLKVIEDNAQAVGAEYQGRKTGSLGDAGCLSFFPSKNLGGYGDGGMVVTNDSAVAKVIRELRTHGWQTKYHPEVLGFNSRLDELQAAILRVKMRYLDTWNGRRREIAERYRTLLANTEFEHPWEAPYAKHTYHLYVIRVKERRAIQEHLRSLGIASGVYYPLPVHQTKPYEHLRYQSKAFPWAERAAGETLAIPLYPQLTDDQVEAVAAGVEGALASAGTRRQRLSSMLGFRPASGTS